ncbi:type VI secretion system baseplate subunit TssE [Paralimibaculum aggregatum]|uniref:Type VI secretion system baseplate subunit TssE n=1 Tax=Paralimibaculum aggregatum TaxID=3036245 RepID=A0ABQ6LHK4_9RHOB|nr:type VI secretion system baseplate subunit TssE [Limibaculum sp. NKW23]GMG81609.1 type VI secretion system baseplate subunit TssE [Limibaculum sp. NKW23]
MADKGIAERLQPSLLDRLTDDAPEDKGETREKRVIDLRRLREIVLRDLTWLFNTTSLESVEDLTDYPHVRRSTVNFGIPDIAGVASSQQRAMELKDHMAERVRFFEPRILPGSFEIEVVDPNNLRRTVVALDIRGELWAQPLPIDLYMRTELDITSGDLSVRNHY